MSTEKQSYYTLLLGIFRERLPDARDGARQQLAKTIVKTLHFPKKKHRRKGLFVRVRDTNDAAKTRIYGPYTSLWLDGQTLHGKEQGSTESIARCDYHGGEIVWELGSEMDHVEDFDYVALEVFSKFVKKGGAEEEA